MVTEVPTSIYPTKLQRSWGVREIERTSSAGARPVLTNITLEKRSSPTPIYPTKPRRSWGLRRAKAETEGFEPSIQFPVYTLSRRAPSTTRTSLQRAAKIGILILPVIGLVGIHPFRHIFGLVLLPVGIIFYKPGDP